MSDDVINQNGAGLYLQQDGELLPVHTSGEQHVTELKAYLHEWDLPGIEVSE